MAVLSELLPGAGRWDAATVERLQLLLAEWQILADLSFADLLLFVPDPESEPGTGYRCVAQMRPYTAQTIYREDLVGAGFKAADRPMVGRAFDEQRVIRDTDPDWSTGVPIREEAIPVRSGEQVVAVVTREANVATARPPSQLERTYLQSAGDLAQMLAEGAFPYPGDDPEQRELSPRVGDGIVRLTPEGVVAYISPNALSAYRRLGGFGDVFDRPLGDVDPGHWELSRALAGGQPLESEVEAGGTVLERRLLPLRSGGELIGGLLLVREVTELRRHQRALRIKDATIREVHHRVKNNLHTITSLLRLQARRLSSPEAEDALLESERRISSIALVHETLSEDSRDRLSFGAVANRIVSMLGQGLADPEVPIDFSVEGEPGELPAEVASPLALVLTELVGNSVEHAFPRDSTAGRRGGTVRVEFARTEQTLSAVIADDGVGLPAGQGLDGLANLGLRISRTLVEAELGGSIQVTPGPGTTIQLSVPLSELS